MAIDWPTVEAEARRHFEALLRIDTTNPPGNEIVAARYLADVLRREGIAFEVIESQPTRGSLVARVRGNGSRAPLLLNGHLDVVPADAEHWTHPPFAAVEADGCLWGRGAVDMKNMVVMSLMTLLLVAREKVELDRDVIFAAVADEEAGSHHGALHLVEKHPDLVRAEFVLNEVGGHTLHMGDRRYCPIQVSEKGICWFELVAHGRPGHGSMPHRDNAVVRIARAIRDLARVRLPQHNTPVVESFLRTVAQGAPFPQRQALPLLLQPALAGALLDVLGRQNPDQAGYIDATLRNTVSPTMTEAGRKINVIPSTARASFDGRVIPGQTVESFLAEVRAVIGDDVQLNVLDRHDGTVFDSRTPLYDAICSTLRRHDPELVPVPYMIPGFTDSFAYARLGAVCYGFAPVRLGPDLNFARMYHGHDERIPIDGFHWGTRVLHDVVVDFCRRS